MRSKRDSMMPSSEGAETSSSEAPPVRRRSTTSMQASLPPRPRPTRKLSSASRRSPTSTSPVNERIEKNEKKPDSTFSLVDSADGSSSQPIQPVRRIKSLDEPIDLDRGGSEMRSLRRMHSSTHSKVSDRVLSSCSNHSKQSREEESAKTSDPPPADSNVAVPPVRRIKSLDKALGQDHERPKLGQRGSSFRFINKSPRVRHSKQILNEETSPRHQQIKHHTTTEGGANRSREDLPSPTTTRDSVIRHPRRSRSCREEKSVTSTRRGSNKAASSIEQDDRSRVVSVERPRSSRVLSRSSSSISISAKTIEATPSQFISKPLSSSSLNCRTTSHRSRSSVVQRADTGNQGTQRMRGDQAPVTPMRPPASPATSDSSGSPPEKREATTSLPPPPASSRAEDSQEDTSPTLKDTKTVVSTSKIKRDPKKPRSRRLLKSNSESVIRSMNMTGEIKTISPSSSESSPNSSEDDDKKPSSSRSGELIPPPPLGSPGSFQSAKSSDENGEARSHSPKSSHQPKKSSPEAPTESIKKKPAPKEKRRFGLTRLAKSFSLGSPKKFSKIPILRRAGSVAVKASSSTIYPEKGVNPARSSGDDSTMRSNTERTVSTVSNRTLSTISSDLSSSHSELDGPFSPLMAQVIGEDMIFDEVANLKTVRNLLARLCDDFDLPTAEMDDDYEDESARRPKSMSSLTSHLEMTRARAATFNEHNREADEDSTMVSNLEFMSPRRALRSSSIRSSTLRSSVPKSLPLSRTSSFDENKGVHFGIVHVREYERTLGDNPSCSAGVPIGLGWNYFHYLEVNVDIYESSVRKPAPRTRKDFFLSPQDRVQILQDECGCSAQEISHAKDLAAELRHQRQVSIFGEDTPQQPRREVGPPGPVDHHNVKRGTKSHVYKQSSRLPMTFPKTDNRWDTSCPAAPSIGAVQ